MKYVITEARLNDIIEKYDDEPQFYDKIYETEFYYDEKKSIKYRICTQIFLERRGNELFLGRCGSTCTGMPISKYICTVGPLRRHHTSGATRSRSTYFRK